MGRPGLPPRAPVVASLDEALHRHWAVVVAHTKCGAEHAMMRQLLNWYSLRHHTLYVDRLLRHGDAIRADTARLAGTTALPVLFVNRRCVGLLSDLHRLDAEAKLKDVLHFGFEWGDLHTDATRAGPMGRVGMLQSAAADGEFYHATYRGAPMAAPVTQMPKLSPYGPE